MGKPPAFQLYASDFDMDTASWDNDEVGIYFRLLMYQWVNGSIPDDVNRMAKIARIGQKRFQKRWRIISKKFQKNGNNDLINQRMEKTRQEQDNYKKSQSDAGKKGIEIKREKGIYPFKQPLKQPLKQPCKPESSSSSSSSLKDIYSAVIKYLNKKAGTNYKEKTKSTERYIKSRLNEGFTQDDFFKVIENQTTEWINDNKMSKYLRPETLFGTKFESYLQRGPAQSRMPKN